MTTYNPTTGGSTTSTTTTYSVGTVSAPRFDASWGNQSAGLLNTFVSHATANVSANIATELIQSLRAVYDGNKRMLADLTAFEQFLSQAEQNIHSARSTAQVVHQAAPVVTQDNRQVATVDLSEINRFESTLLSRIQSVPQSRGTVVVQDDSHGMILALLRVLMIPPEELRVNERVRYLLTLPYFEYIWNYLHYRPTRVVNPPVQQQQVVAQQPIVHHQMPVPMPVPVPQPVVQQVVAQAPWSGLELTDSATNGRGARVYSVNHGGPAHRAGVQPDDMVVSFNDRRITCKGDFGAAMSVHQAGDTIVLGISRDGRAVDYQVTLEGQPRGFSPRRQNSYRVGYRQ
jgi:hypothetical protein